MGAHYHLVTGQPRSKGPLSYTFSVESLSQNETPPPDKTQSRPYDGTFSNKEPFGRMAYLSAILLVLHVLVPVAARNV